MRSLGLSLPRAYCFVRARRLNVIIQPHLRFIYELLKWEESLQTQSRHHHHHHRHHRRQQKQKQRHADRNVGDVEAAGFRRELEWAEIAREIALMNRPYARG